MMRNGRSWFCLSALLLLSPGSWAEHLNRSIDSAEVSAQQEVYWLSSLRSAFLIRQGITGYDRQSSTPAALRGQLQQHFDVVLALLSAATGPSIEKSLDRLETARAETWSTAERAQWRTKLLTARRIQVQRLKNYRDRGQFPKNDGHAAHPVPIFVDKHDTACAVGHLMRESGHSEQVDLIAAANNLIYVPDAADSPLADWVLTSGLTLEEAALIQPSYFWEDFPAGSGEGLDTLLGAGATFERDGLRYSNFSFETETVFSYDESVPAITIAIIAPQLANATSNALPSPDESSVFSLNSRLNALIETFDDEGNLILVPVEHTFLEPIRTNLLWLGLPMETRLIEDTVFQWDQIIPSFINHITQRAHMSFDVTPISDGKLIDELVIAESHFLGGFDPFFNAGSSNASGPSTIEVTASNSGGEIGSALYVHEGPDSIPIDGGFWTKSLQFSPESVLSVQVEVLHRVPEDAEFGSFDSPSFRGFGLHLNVVTVPEPSTGIFAALMSCALLFWQRGTIV